MKDIELRLISELIKNSRRSDRELAKAVGTSQPTVTRIRTKLEEKGYIKEYTAIPDFKKLGYEILALHFVQLKKGLSEEEVEEARKTARENLDKVPLGIIMIERGIGLDYNGVLVSYHKNYASYLELLSWLKNFTAIPIARIDSFLVSLSDEVHYLPLTFAVLAKHIALLNSES